MTQVQKDCSEFVIGCVIIIVSEMYNDDLLFQHVNW